MKKAGDKAARQEVKSHCIYALSYQSYPQTFLYFLVIKYQVLRLFGKLYTRDVKQEAQGPKLAWERLQAGPLESFGIYEERHHFGLYFILYSFSY